MKNSVLYSVVATALLAADSSAHAQGLFDVFEDAASTPVAAARDIAAAATKTAAQSAAATARAGRETVYLSGDGTETLYEYHPGACLGRKAGMLPQGKLGLLPSHDAAESAPKRQSSEASENRQALDTKVPQAAKQPSTIRDQRSSAQVVRHRRLTVGPRRSRRFVSRLFRFARR